MSDFKRQQRDFEHRLLVALLAGIFAIVEIGLASTGNLGIALIVLWWTSLAVCIAAVLTAKDEPDTYDPEWQEFEACRAVRPCGSVERTYERVRGEA